MSKQISFIHAADLHLDSPFKGLTNTPEHIFQEIQESTFVALERLVSAAIQKQVDFVLIVGDLFDNEKQSLKAQIRLRRAFEELNDHHINVYVSYGNHDHLNGNKYPVTYPDNVFIFPTETVSQFTYEKEGKSIASIYGFSYENRAVIANKTKEYQITDDKIPFHIAMLHGSVQSNTDHDMYAPFQIGELSEIPFDYWALGHIHQREVLKENPTIVYPGNTQGRNRKEIGEKGCYHIVLSATGTAMSFIPLQALEFTPLIVDVSTCEEIHQVEKEIQTIIKDQPEPTTPQLIDLTLVSNNENLIKWKSEAFLEDIIDLVNETGIYQSNWYYIFRHVIKVDQILVDSDLSKGDHFIGELTRDFEDISIYPFITDLFHHKQGRKHLNTLTKEDESLIKKEAQQLLINELLKS